MSDIGNDIFKYENQWYLFKGNQYMNNKLHKIHSAVHTKCPKSYIHNKNMRKNHLEPIFNQYERNSQNKCLKNKLHKIYSNHLLNDKQYYLNNKFLPYNSMISNKVSKGLLDKADYYANNRNLSLRIINAKSFFEREKLLKNSLKPNSPLCNSKNINWSLNLNVKKLSQSLNVSRTNQNISENSTGLKTMKTLKTFDETTKKSHSITVENRFKYSLLNNQLIEKDKKSLVLFAQKIFIEKFGLINCKIMYYYNRMVIIIKPFSSLRENTFLIIINGKYNLQEMNKIYSSYNNIVQNIIFDDEEKFVFNKKENKFKYSTHVLSRDKFQNIDLEKECISFC